MKRYQALFPQKTAGIHKGNEGVGAVWNDRVEIAKEEYTGFVNAGDSVAPAAFEEMNARAKKEKCQCGCDVFQAGFASFMRAAK